MPAGRETAGQRASLASKTLSAPVSNVVITASAGGLRPLIAARPSPVGGRCSGRFFGSRTRSAAAVRVLRLWTETGRIVAAASPVALIGLLNMMLGLTDMVMVGRYDPTGLGAIVVVGDLNSIVFNCKCGLSPSNRALILCLSSG